MSARVVFGCLLFAVAGYGAAQKVADRPPPPAEPFTAFPGIVPPQWPDSPEAEMAAAVLKKDPRSVPADAPPLEQVRLMQVNEGLACLDKIRARVRIGTYSYVDYLDHVTMAADVYRAMAEVEPTADGKVGALAARVAALKEMERFTRVRVEAGADQPHQLNKARFYRLQAEKELLLLQAELAKAGNK